MPKWYGLQRLIIIIINMLMAQIAIAAASTQGTLHHQLCSIGALSRRHTRLWCFDHIFTWQAMLQ
jgi:hypothetical protein